MSKMTRRNAIVMSVAAPALGAAFPLGGEVDQSMVGINIKVAWLRDGWHVLMPDWENVGSYWQPGRVVPNYWVPIAEYFKTLEDEFKLKPFNPILTVEKLRS